jgi:hypothetical protein
VLGIAAAEKRLATETDGASQAQRRLADWAKKAREQMELGTKAAKAEAAAVASISNPGVRRITGAGGGMTGRIFAMNALGAQNRADRAAISTIRGNEASAAAARVAASMQAVQAMRTAPLQAGAADFARRRAIMGQIADSNRDAHSAVRDRIANGGDGRGRGAGGIFARIGGALGGGALSKIGGAIGMPTAGLAALGLGAVAAGMALKEFGAHVERAKQEITRVGELKNDLRESIRTAFAGANAAAIGEAKGNRSAIAALIGAGKLEQAQKEAGGMGEGGLRAMGALQQKGLMTDPVMAAMKLAVGTGQMSAEQFATTIGGKRGLAAAGDPESIARAVMANAGIHGVDLKGAGAAFGGSAFGKSFGSLDAAEAHRQRAALGRFAAGGTDGQIREEAARIADPQTAAMVEFKRKMDDQQQILDAIAESQGKMAALWDAIANRADSATQTSRRTARQNAAVVNPSE